MAAKRTRTSLAEHFSETWQSIALAGVDGILGEASRLFSGQGGRVKTDVGDAMTVYHAPFAACTLKDVFDDGFLEGVKSEFVLQRFVPKSNDLYHFEQTGDFKKAADTGAVAPLLKTLRSAIYSDAFMSVIETIAGVKLRRETMDISGHRYRDGSYLLCHDDELEGRKIAFILYLVPKDWSEVDGGRLDLFYPDANGQPSTKAEHLVPCWNSITFFKVIPQSFHQVSEVLTATKDRLSVSGWFYSDDPVERPPSWEEELPVLTALTPLAPDTRLDEEASSQLSRWLNPEYVKAASLQRIQDTFMAKSSVELHKILRDDVYKALSDAIAATGDKAEHGPINRRLYLTVNDQVLADFMAFVRSQSFAAWLMQVSSLQLDGVQSELREFGAGHYTLVHDHYKERLGLDVVFSFTDPSAGKWNTSRGGSLVYLAEGETEELLTSAPQPNSLLVVLRDQGVLRFVKYLDHHTTYPRRDLSLVYTEHVQDVE